MKKITINLLSLILCAIISLCMAGCGERNPYRTIMSGNRFVIVSELTTDNTVYVEMYDINTKVMYCYIKLSESGSFCPLVDQDGKPLLWQGE